LANSSIWDCPPCGLNVPDELPFTLMLLFSCIYFNFIFEAASLDSFWIALSPLFSNAKDLALLNSGDKAIQKLSNDAASKIKLKYIQEKSNINVNGNSSGTFNPQGGQSQIDELAKHFFAETN